MSNAVYSVASTQRFVVDTLVDTTNVHLIVIVDVTICRLAVAGKQCVLMSRNRFKFIQQGCSDRFSLRTLFRQKLTLATGTLAGLLVAACSTTVKAPVDEPRVVATVPGPAVIEKAVTGTRPGAYYKDDGPPELVPVDLAKVKDAEPKVEQLHKYANSPYSVMGSSYVPERDYKPYRIRGVASWYGKKFHGQKTSSGEKYDMFAMTAAHPTLPIPSYARVTNVANGKSVVVKINDRGPFHKGRVMDLSYAAAYRLGYASAGSATVEIETIGAEEIASFKRNGKWGENSAQEPLDSTPLADAAVTEKPLDSIPAESTVAAIQAVENANRGLFLQIGAFRNKDNAANLKSRLLNNSDITDEQINVVNKEGMFRIHVGPYDSEQSARLAAVQLRDRQGVNVVLVR
jgi:rare lipoprotein A